MNLKKLIEQTVSETLLESRRSVTVFINGREFPFGHERHVADLQRTLEGLERVRDCFEKGSGHRLMYGQACSRLKKLVNELSAKADPPSEEHLGDR